MKFLSRTREGWNSPRIDLRSPLTFRNAFLFPLQCPGALWGVLLGGLVLFVPFVGFALNMGCRLRMVSRMQRGLSPWPCWREPRMLWRKGVLATITILAYHLPALLIVLLALVFRRPSLFVLGLGLGACATFLLPGFMTFYAHDGKTEHLKRPDRALRRVLSGGQLYLKAWGIGIVACLLSFGGLLFFGVGFAWTSVWFWQVAAFCFSRVFSEQYGLMGTESVSLAQS